MDLFFELLQVALGTRENLSRVPCAAEWRRLFEEAERQAVAGVIFPAIEDLSRCGQKPPSDVLYEWIGLAEQVKQQNSLINVEATRLTRLFEGEGHRTAILKGQANALFYPCPSSRQPGDIDIWVSGGKEAVIKSLRKLGLLNGGISKYDSEHATQSYHHIHLPQNENGIDVEVHFRPSSGNHDPFTNRRLQAFLNDEIDREKELADAGFRVPTLKFALVMQLAHIQRHFFSLGVGLRQIIDYYYLLRSLKGDYKEDNTELLSPVIMRRMGLKHIAGAMMWVLHEKLGLEEDFLIAPMDEERGRMLLAVVMEGGNFGHYSQQRQEEFSIAGSLKYRLKKYELLRFDARETIWGELNYIASFVTSIPERIRRRSWTLRGNSRDVEN